MNSQKLFDSFDLTQIAVRDNGVLQIERGAAINKKFKYFNNSEEEISIEVISNIPQIVCIKTNNITIPKNGGYDFVKFLVLPQNNSKLFTPTLGSNINQGLNQVLQNNKLN